MKRLLASLLALTMLLAGARAQEDIFAASPTAAVGSIGLPLSEYIYTEGSNSTLGVLFPYPSHWEYVPGRRTVCFKEPVADGDIPARMTISVKQLESRAKEEAMISQLASLMRTISAQYEQEADVGNLITDTDFMGKDGYSTIYRAAQGDKTIRGYVIMACVGTKIYAYHFCAEEEDYAAMTQMMQYIRDNIKANNS